MSRPSNSPFDRPPSKATRSSTSDVYVAPELRSSGAVIRRTASTSSTTRTQPPASAAVVTTTETSDVFINPPITSVQTIPTTAVATTATMPDPGEGTSATATTTTAAASTASTVALTTAPIPTATYTTTVSTMVATAGYDSALAPPPFKGTSQEDGEVWLSRFEKYVTYRGFQEREILNLLAVLLRDNAGDWFDTLSEATKNSWVNLRTAFRERFQDSDLLQWQKATDLWSRVQGPDESVDAYVTVMLKMAKAVSVQGDQLRYAIQRGLKPQLLGHVIQTQPSSVEELVKAARVAEAAAKATAAAVISDAPFANVVAELAANRQAAEQNTAELRRFTTQLSATTVGTVGRSATPPPQRPASPRRVTFSDQARWEQPPTFAAPTSSQRRPTWRGASTNGMRRNNNQQSSTSSACTYCGGNHPRGANYCRAAGITCFNCKRRGHFARMCRGGRRPTFNYPDQPEFSA